MGGMCGGGVLLRCYEPHDNRSCSLVADSDLNPGSRPSPKWANITLQNAGIRKTSREGRRNGNQIFLAGGVRSAAGTCYRHCTVT
jgi:hypothetical protein